MSYDPSGDTRLDGEAILKILAKHLGIEAVDLEAALKCVAFNQANPHKIKDKEN